MVTKFIWVILASVYRTQGFLPFLNLFLWVVSFCGAVYVYLPEGAMFAIWQGTWISFLVTLPIGLYQAKNVRKSTEKVLSDFVIKNTKS